MSLMNVVYHDMWVFLFRFRSKLFTKILVVTGKITVRELVFGKILPQERRFSPACMRAKIRHFFILHIIPYSIDLSRAKNFFPFHFNNPPDDYNRLLSFAELDTICLNHPFIIISCFFQFVSVQKYSPAVFAVEKKLWNGHRICFLKISRRIYLIAAQHSPAECHASVRRRFSHKLGVRLAFHVAMVKQQEQSKKGVCWKISAIVPRCGGKSLSWGCLLYTSRCV